MPAQRLVPFGLPTRDRADRAAILGPLHFVAVVTGVALLPLSLGLLLYPGILDAIDRREILRYRATFGYTVGDIPTDRGFSYWGVTSVAPDSLAARAGLRPRDALVGRSASLLRAVKEAAAGRRACVEVWNVDAPNPRDSIRSVCFQP